MVDKMPNTEFEHMTAVETVKHFSDMGCLNESDLKGNMPIIHASAPEGYAMRCMRDFSGKPGTFYAKNFIFAVTKDNVPVLMRYTDAS